MYQTVCIVLSAARCISYIVRRTSYLLLTTYYYYCMLLCKERKCLWIACVRFIQSLCNNSEKREEMFFVAAAFIFAAAAADDEIDGKLLGVS